MQLIANSSALSAQLREATQKWWDSICPFVSHFRMLQASFAEALTPDEMTVNIIDLEITRRMIEDTPYPSQIERPRYYLLQGFNRHIQSLMDYQTGHPNDGEQNDALAREHLLYFQLCLRLLGIMETTI